MNKKILIIGNGFDLAHGLPTSYSDFLEFAKRALAIYSFYNKDGLEATFNNYKRLHIDNWCVGKSSKESAQFLKDRLCSLFKKRESSSKYNKDGTRDLDVTVDKRLDEFYRCLCNNIWYLYISDLYEKNRMKGENWIDFESEISYVIQFIDEKPHSMSEIWSEFFSQLVFDSKSNIKISLFCKAFNDAYSCREDKKDRIKPNINLDGVRSLLYDDLERLIYALNIYLNDFIEKIEVSTKLPVIERIKPDYVISFNYTKTFERFYDHSPELQVCHIHGTCDGDRSINENNMVLGIDEYVPDSEKNERVDFAIFKKFVQRIRKRNDVSYATWADEIDMIGEIDRWLNNGERTSAFSLNQDCYDVFVFGHSLDITDKDIISRFLASDYTRVHIYAKDKASEGVLITSLLRIVDQSIIIAKSTTSPTKIEFLDSRTIIPS